jgi:transposase
MTRYRPAYPPEFRRQMIDLVRAGRTPEELSREFEPSAASIAGWVRRADAEDGTRPDVMTAAEREELARLRRENRQLRREGDILAKGEPSKAPPVRARWRTPGSRRRRTGVRTDADEPGRLFDPRHGPCA